MEGGLTSDPPPTNAELFNNCLPYYLAIGMTYDQFWKQDCTMVKAFRKADEIRRKRINEEAWLQGAYFYNALCCVAPVLHAFAKNGTEPLPYMEQPIAITNNERERREEQEMKARADRFAAFVEAKNAEFRKRKEGGGSQ